ncbi:hypothetical protein [uncultured Kordia sp.]|uniref:hypothetical protein n=1 Tax=uncultured Kordia sp. TaxID=507699 RepID=UPI0026116CD3|nr:hypothetical protein [uncultured Kordia sp.]
MKLQLLLLATFFFLSSHHPLHKDTILKIDKNGNILGLPAEYGKARFNLKNKHLRIKDKKITFPRCVREYFETSNTSNIRVLASWYHSKEIMPYYIKFEIYQEKKARKSKILLNLETLELMRVEVSTLKEKWVSNDKVELGKTCLERYKQCIRSVK